MCLAAIAIDQARRFPLVVAANRDEYFDRPAASLAWWAAADGGPDILGGRDLHGGGTWLGLTAAGRLALLTNIRRPGAQDAAAPSRGAIVPLWLRGDLDAERYWARVAVSGHNPFNLIAADFRRGECFWATSDLPVPRRLDRGLYGLSNAALDTPWPKVRALKASLCEALESAESAQSLSTKLFAALSDRAVAGDADLPATGIPLERERQLSPAFIRADDLRYGTRCSTLVIAERVDERLVTQVYERTFPASGGPVLRRRVSLRDWPPRVGDAHPVASQIPHVADLADEPAPVRPSVRALPER